MARFLDLLADVRSAAYGAPDAILIKSIRRAVQELCQSTQCWQEPLEGIVLRTGESRYELQPPFGATVERIVSLKIDGVALRCQQRYAELHALQTTTGRPSVWSHEPMEPFVAFWPTPTVDEDGFVVDILAALAPTETSQNIPDDLAAKHRQGIVAYAKYDLLANAPEMPWHNPENASHHRSNARDWFSRAKRAQHSGHSMPLTVRQRPFI